MWMKNLSFQFQNIKEYYIICNLYIFFVSVYFNRKLKTPYRPIQTLIWNKFMTLIKTPWKPTWKNWNGTTDVSRTTNNTGCQMPPPPPPPILHKLLISNSLLGIPQNSENKPRGLYFSNALFEGLIFGGAYIRRGLSTEGNLRFKIDWASL